MIEAIAVGVRYGTAVALADVTLTVERGEWLAVIGPNGAGKTTLLTCLAHLVRYDGEIRLDGRPLAALSRRAIARSVAYVPQRPTFPPEMTVGDYVLLGRTPHISYLGTESAKDREICAELIARLRLSEMTRRRLATLSGGELQRLVLARALAQQAPVLLLDEPTSALDLGRRVDALELVDELRQERGLTIVSAIHDLTLAGQFADTLTLLAGGRQVATGSGEQVLRPEILTPQFGIGIDVIERDGERVVVSRRRAARS